MADEMTPQGESTGELEQQQPVAQDPQGDSGHQDQAEQQPEDTAASPDEQDPAESGAAKPKSGVQKRIDSAVRKQRDAERDRDYWRNVALGGMQPQPEAKEPEPAPKPTLEQFEKYEDYVEAVADWKAEQKLNQRLKEFQANNEASSAAKEQLRTLHAKMEDGRAKFDDFDAVTTDPALTITPNMHGVMMHSDKFAEIAYYLGTHPEEALRISRLPNAAQALQLGRLEAKFEAEAEAAGEAQAPPPPAARPPQPQQQQPQRRLVSQAPAPVKPLGGNESASKDPSKMTDEEWIEWRNKQERRQRKAS